MRKSSPFIFSTKPLLIAFTYPRIVKTSFLKGSAKQSHATRIRSLDLVKSDDALCLRKDAALAGLLHCTGSHHGAIEHKLVGKAANCPLQVCCKCVESA